MFSDDELRGLGTALYYALNWIEERSDITDGRSGKKEYQKLLKLREKVYENLKED